MPTSQKRDSGRRAAPPGGAAAEERGPRPPAAAPYHHGDLRRALLAIAEQRLARDGPAALSLREIARAAGVSHNAPYRHFPDREALLAALAAEGFRRLAAALAEAAAGAPPGERLRATGRAYLGFARDHRALYLLMFGPGLDKGAHPPLREAARAALDVLHAAVAAAGLPPGARARHAAIGAWALVHGLAHLIADGQIPGEPSAGGHAALVADALGAYAAGLERIAEGRNRPGA
ncbi:TetR/AcrR family transcriptional regulator [Crenalkalicoccus roseus]|uniref:TetR/AcrR family transcriptional regulator n=1 Tax=Crenalkalicoccus roseus TaxID=1485588 RepID=UPI0010816C77|nr:TetR/AcrR family transcriptional regulator [Crenalkalicoccus roseus]